MTQLQEFFDYFTCKVCFQSYGATHTPFVICNNHHLLCNQCISTMIDAKSGSVRSLMECPFCKDQMQFTDMWQDRQVLQIKGIVAKVKRQEQNQRDQNTFLRNKCESLEEENRVLIESPCSMHAKKESQKRLVCYCKSKYFSNPIEEIKVHIDNISELMKKLKKRQQDKMILHSIFSDQPSEHSFNPQAKIEVDSALPLSKIQQKIEIEKLADKFLQLIGESLKNSELMGQMLDVYRKKQANLRQRQRWLDEQLREKETQIKKEAHEQILKYRMDFEQQIKKMRSNMEGARQQLKNTIQKLSREIRDKNDEIKSLKKDNQLIKQKHKQAISQLNSNVHQHYGKFEEDTKRQSRYPNHTENNAGYSVNLRSLKDEQPKKIKRRIAIQSSMMPGNKRLEARIIKEQANDHIPTGDLEKKGPSRQSKHKIIRPENIIPKK